ncbi:hypothetical protein EV189_3801 [Motilibacter rhizosphaerae]|uniref:Uncharacterized protein n=1 Tax=Motilibacter rhizosphaerae TaxID=598652 RepID=A0A4Q7NAL1_9ACTN|nr:hypothetical protein [Motilibacter rhizosphaerae]RZS79447.1 hypothetical protein EV189_3801 [Motilibacter rhizosphaerae]
MHQRGTRARAARLLAALACTALAGLVAAAPARAQDPTVSTDATGPLVQATAMAPGAPQSACVRVSWTGATDAALVPSATASGPLADYLDLRVERGSGGAYGDCTGFSGTTVFTGTLAEYALLPRTSASSIAVGVRGDGTTTYRLTVSVEGDDRAQGASATASFAWSLLDVDAPVAPVPPPPVPSAAPTPAPVGPPSPTPTPARTRTPSPAPSPARTPSPRATPASTPTPGEDPSPSSSASGGSGGPGDGGAGGPGDAPRDSGGGSGSDPGSGSDAGAGSTGGGVSGGAASGGRAPRTGSAPTRPRATTTVPLTGSPDAGPSGPGQLLTDVGSALGRAALAPLRPFAKPLKAVSAPLRALVSPLRGLLPSDLSTIAPALSDASTTVARHSGFPSALLVVVLAFLGLQDRIDRRDPKLAAAPLYSDPHLPFPPDPPDLVPAGGPDDPPADDPTVHHPTTDHPTAETARSAP